MPFDAFSPDLLTFLRELGARNDRDWFAARKPAYEAHYKQAGEAFADAMAVELGRISAPPVTSKQMRIFRDVRFSKDKTPYNTWLRILFTPARGAPWFFGLDADGVTLGTGVFELKKEPLQTLRDRMAGPDGEALEVLLTEAQADGLRVSEPELKRVPAGFAADHPRAEMLRRKSLTVWTDHPPEFATAPDLVSRAMAEYRRLVPIRDWLG
ncbi:DUF2461 domain-containing protein [Pseudaestuariivita atlantica]|uniref:TIGR02453 family protein n=1 Tax=Pseudaestuariivita atlantica TaxID=1317121 RepID=A0A0L1JL25_9RHOB|nr:DUF2461 domain-containing protein [Pseudaestuariivita atlantica]KNG92445.1 hypothetical protein ATO11_17720 [Pseudaestuariivita atlantica]